MAKAAPCRPVATVDHKYGGLSICPLHYDCIRTQQGYFQAIILMIQKLTNIEFYDKFLRFISIAVCFFTAVQALFSIVRIEARLINYFQQSPADGVFQTLFPLRRIDAGQFPGRDFYYFHGNGIPYLLYPFYKIGELFFVGPLQASMAAACVADTLCLVVPTYILARLILDARGALITVMAFMIVIEKFPMFGYLFEATFPGAPMTVRMLPHMLAAIFIVKICLYAAKSVAVFKRVLGAFVLAGGVCGILPLLGAEQGFYAVAGGVAVSPFMAGQWTWRQRVAFPIAFLLSFCISFIAIQLVFFGSLDTLRAIGIISANQVWVYGVFPAPFFNSWEEFFSVRLYSALPSQLATSAGTVAIVFSIWTYRKKWLSVPAFCAILTLYISALLSWVANFGYVGGHQAPLFMRVCIIAAAFNTPAIVQIILSFAGYCRSKIVQGMINAIR